MRKVLAVVVLVGCGSSPPSAPVPPTAPPPAVAASPRVDRRVVIAEGRPSGTLVTTTAPDGTITLAYDVVENGRGPHIDATLVLAADGTPTAWTATGHHTFGTKVEEHFTRTGAHATWKSIEEAGAADTTVPTFYVPVSEIPVNQYLVSAARQAGGSLALFPGGQVTVREVARMDVAGHKVVGYAITGWWLLPAYTWFDESGAWFGDISPWSSIIPPGAEAAIAPLNAKQDELDRVRGAELAKLTAHVPPAAGLAYTHARVLDVERGAWRPDQTVVVVGDKITAVGAKAAIPKGAEIVDLAGKALIPGLVDMHSHTSEQDAILDIASGVTTVRDVGNDPDTLDDMKARFDAGTAVGPHVVRMGFIEGRGEKAASSKVTAETPAEAVAAVEFFAKRGYEGIKIYNSMKVELVPVLAAEAHKRGMLVIGHIPVHMLAHEAIEAGYDGVEHINQVMLNFLASHETDTRDITRFTLVGDGAADLDLTGKPVRDFVAMLAAKKIIIDPTLVAFDGMYNGVAGTITPGWGPLTQRLPVQVARGYLSDGLPVSPERRAKFARSWATMLAMVKAMWVAKVPIVAGVDGIGGVGLHHELELLVQAGIPTAGVLQLATIGSARAMKMETVFGTIAVGKRADLVVLAGDPLADIASVRAVVTTMRSGVVFPAAPLFAAVSVKP